jgi:hypothetical protein
MEKYQDFTFLDNYYNKDSTRIILLAEKGRI